MGTDGSLASKSARSLCLNITLLARECLIPSIIDAWFALSDKMVHPGNVDPKIVSVASLPTKQEVKTNALFLLDLALEEILIVEPRIMGAHLMSNMPWIVS